MNPKPPFLVIRDHILDLLVKAQEKRSKLHKRVESEHDDFPVEEWILHERETMFNAVNDERAKIGKPPVPITEIVRVENMAKGHCDYSTKYALYCAELVLA